MLLEEVKEGVSVGAEGGGEVGGRRRRGGRGEVGVQRRGEPVGKVDGDRWKGLAKKFSASVGGGGKVVDNEGVDDFRVQDKNCWEAQRVGLKGKAEGVGFGLVDVGVSGANERWNAEGAGKTWVGASIKAGGVSNWGA